MKTTIDIPEGELSDAMRFTGAKTKKEAVVTALADYNRRHKMAELIKYSGTFTSLLSNDEIEQLEAAKRKRLSK
jgi:Arc/MetJ family transcription regulator